MTETYLILKSTDKVRRAINNQSVNDTYQSLVELRDDMREYPVDDDSYEPTLESLEDITKEYKIFKDAEDAKPADTKQSVSNVIQRVRSIYLRNIPHKTSDKNPLDQIRERINQLREDISNHSEVELDNEHLTRSDRSILNKANSKDREIVKVKSTSIKSLVEITDSMERIVEERDVYRNVIEEMGEELNKIHSQAEEMGSDWDGLDPETQKGVNDVSQNGDEYIDELKSMKEEFDDEFYNED